MALSKAVESRGKEARGKLRRQCGDDQPLGGSVFPILRRPRTAKTAAFGRSKRSL